MADIQPSWETLGPVGMVVDERDNGHSFQAYTHYNAGGFAAELWISGPRMERIDICSYHPIYAPDTGERLDEFLPFLVVVEADVSPERALEHLMGRWGETVLIR
jgi:hypothetical protein